jgi:hypothetical protein
LSLFIVIKNYLDFTRSNQAPVGATQFTFVKKSWEWQPGLAGPNPDFREVSDGTKCCMWYECILEIAGRMCDGVGGRYFLQMHIPSGLERGSLVLSDTDKNEWVSAVWAVHGKLCEENLKILR